MSPLSITTSALVDVSVRFGSFRSGLQYLKTSKISLTPSTTQLTDSKIMLTRECFFLLPGAHWSLPNWDKKPLLPRWLLTSLMFGEAVTGFAHSYMKKDRAMLGK